MSFEDSGRGAAWLARLLGVQEVAGSNPVAPILAGLNRKFLLGKGLRFLFLGGGNRVRVSGGLEKSGAYYICLSNWVVGVGVFVDGVFWSTRSSLVAPSATSVVGMATRRRRKAPAGRSSGSAENMKHTLATTNTRRVRAQNLNLRRVLKPSGEVARFFRTKLARMNAWRKPTKNGMDAP